MGEAYSKIGCPMDLTVKANPSGTAWYAVQTHYRHEQRVSSDLAMKGFETYLPLLRETRQWTDRKKTILVPAFSGYAFVRYEASLDSRVRVLETAGVVRLLGNNHSPAPVADLEIESLQRTLESDAPCDRCEYLPLGAMVEVKRGALAGVRGRLVRNNNGPRLILSVSTVAQAISVEVNLEDVEAVPETSHTQSSSNGLEEAAHRA